MNWTALIPLKQAGDRKLRLASRLDPLSRARLGARMFVHVYGELKRSPKIASVFVLSAARPEAWHDGWLKDHGGGLNVELERARQLLHADRLLVIHGDLPLVTTDEIDDLLSAAEATGLALAPDRHGTGTNALAIADRRPFEFEFGEDSFRRHRTRAGNLSSVVERRGLALDLDTPADLDAATAAGFAGAEIG